MNNFVLRRISKRWFVLIMVVGIFVPTTISSVAVAGTQRSGSSSSFEPDSRVEFGITCQGQCIGEATATATGLMRTEVAAPAPKMYARAFARVRAFVPGSNAKALTAQLIFTVEASQDIGTSPWGDAYTEFNVWLGPSAERAEDLPCNGLSSGEISKRRLLLGSGTHNFTAHLKCPDGSRYRGTIVGWVEQTSFAHADFGFFASSAATTTVQPVTVTQ